MSKKNGTSKKSQTTARDGMPPRKAQAESVDPVLETPETPETPAEKKTEVLATFAIRLPEADRELIHLAAGRGKATAWAREVLVRTARELVLQSLERK